MEADPKANLEIRSISSLDPLLKDLIDLYLLAYKDIPQYAFRDPRRVKGYLRWLLKHAQGGFWVAFVKQRPVGLIAIQPDAHFQGEEVAEIHEFLVAPDYRHTGVAEKLLETALSFLKDRGHQRVALWVGEGNERARDFYRRHGFNETARQGVWLRMEAPLASFGQKVNESV
ncbi:GNAT family N-acetyltransferase [Thermosulfuriphilus sp.]